MNNRLYQQQGIGLIEVMVALGLVLLTAMAIGNLQITGMHSARTSSVHFALDQLSSEMLETLRSQSVDAQAGLFEFDGSVQPAGTVLAEVSSWNSRLEDAIPTGVGAISCSSGFCDVSISWLEEVDETRQRLVYRTRTPL